MTLRKLYDRIAYGTVNTSLSPPANGSYCDLGPIVTLIALPPRQTYPFGNVVIPFSFLYERGRNASYADIKSQL